MCEIPKSMRFGISVVCGHLQRKLHPSAGVEEGLNSLTVPQVLPTKYAVPEQHVASHFRLELQPTPVYPWL
jgi:hypothetical protein